MLRYVHLLSCFLLWSLFAVGIDGSSTTDNRIIEIQNKLLNVQSQIMSLNVTLNTESNLELVKNRLALLEEAFHELRNQMNEDRRSYAAESAKYQHAIATLITYYERLDRELQDLKAEIRRKEEVRPTDSPGQVMKKFSCVANILPLPFSIFGIPCRLFSE